MDLTKVHAARDTALSALADVAEAAGLETWRQRQLGKAGPLTELLKAIPQLPAEERPGFGQAVNAVKQALEEAYEARLAELRAAELDQELAAERIDVTLPGSGPPAGGLHPSTQALRRIAAIFAEMGFQVYQSREVESDAYNFELLNIPRHHPARDMQDTFFVDEDVVLRTHTSPGQIHAMRQYAPEPVRVILPGMVYRHEQITPRSEVQFNQVEGLAIGPGITMADLKGTVENFVSRMFGPGRALRFRASYFPFTEPSAEVDVRCFLCGGEGCRVCKQSGWLEIMGCGMVHPVVLAHGGYDPAQVTGFAFGMGLERSAMQVFGIDDVRHFWANDLRFLAQFR
jgi:phenylalanyl-tRNA synthetase alpha chain